MSLHKIDISRVTETGHPKGQPYKLNHHPNYTSFWSNVINKHAGVGLVLHRKWCPYVQNTFLHSDQFIYVDLFFKGNIKVRIIVVYLHADLTARLQRQAVQSQLIELLNTSQTAKYYIIIMGDFNANLEQFYHSVSKYNKGQWQYILFHYLQQYRFTDLQLMFSADQSNPDPTFKSSQNGAMTRIDAIFTSLNFPFILLHCHTRKSFLYLSDHLIVAAYFQPIESKKEHHDKRLRTKHKVYNVSSMEDADWQAFADYSDKYYKEYNYKRYDDLTSNKKNLNILWTKIKELLITTANHTVPCIYRSSEDSLSKPKSLTSCYTTLKKLNNILLQFRTKYLSCSL